MLKSPKAEATCFVLMPFSKDYIDIYTDLYWATCEELKINCSRIDDEEHMKPGNISKDILHQIENADIIITDTSSNNPNVFYELGYAHKVNFNKVILTRSKNDSDFPFDIKDVRTIIYDRDFKTFGKSKALLKKMILHVLNDKTFPETSVKLFYNNIRIQDYKKAWEYLDPKFRKNRWDNNVQAFVKGYKHTVSMSHLNISMTAHDSSIAKFNVSFIEETNCPVINEFQNFGRKTLSQLNNIREDSEKLKLSLNNLGYNEQVIDDLTFNQLVSPNRGATIEWLLNKEDNNHDRQIFRIKNLARYHCCLEVTVTKNKSNWLISKIRPIDVE